LKKKKEKKQGKKTKGNLGAPSCFSIAPTSKKAKSAPSWFEFRAQRAE